ncbi:restriction endonuclease subunit S [Salinadaptatus halalkaliphilus]|uniref:Restriction endonuclease subunit S n=1 Tax=Salinadaptatus halalkaliphilus TaxID=2419781 RepID=A0A4S3TQD5_9EURY|nr:restriction endonuclease subunit S [Salinadaptatus halalkaliphilus]THE64758.1 restriction endonuclease subunit S [Salinadaptatus halalkaliphilus]
MRTEPRPKPGMQQVSIGPVFVEIPEDWDLVSLNGITENSGQYGANASAEEYDPDEFRYVRITDLSEEGYLENDEMRSIPIDGNEKYRLKEGDLLFARTGAVGRSYLYSEADCDVPCAFAGYLIRFKLSDEVCDEYINQFTNSQYFRKWVDSMARSTTHANINASEYASVEIPYPPLPEQRRIADILSTVDEQIQQTDEIIEEAKELKRGVMQNLLHRGIGHDEFKEMYIGPKRSTIPTEWDVVQLREIANIKSGSTPKRSNEEYWEDGSIPWIKSGEFNDGVIEQAEEKITEKALEESGCVVFPKGTLLLALYGKGTVSKTARLGLDAATNQAIAGLLPKNKAFDPRYLQYYLIGSRNTLLNVTVNPSSDAARTNIYLSALRQFKIALPPIEEQRIIADRISTIDDKIADEQEHKQTLQELKRGLMQDLLTGKVRVNTEN